MFLSETRTFKIFVVAYVLMTHVTSKKPNENFCVIMARKKFQLAHQPNKLHDLLALGISPLAQSQ